MVPVPRLTPSIGAMSTLWQNFRNSSVPKWLDSTENQEQLARSRALRLRPDAVQPVIAAEEVPARVPDDRVAQLPERSHHVGAQAILVRERGWGS